MEIIVVIVMAGAIGTLLTISPVRDATYTGVLTIPATSVLVTLVYWTGFLWLGAAPESPLMWIVPLVLGAGAGLAMAGIQRSIRTEHAERRLTELLRG